MIARATTQNRTWRRCAGQLRASAAAAAPIAGGRISGRLLRLRVRLARVGARLGVGVLVARVPQRGVARTATTTLQFGIVMSIFEILMMLKFEFLMILKFEIDI